jgi:hypothetical protein
MLPPVGFTTRWRQIDVERWDLTNCLRIVRTETRYFSAELLEAAS